MLMLRVFLKSLMLRLFKSLMLRPFALKSLILRLFLTNATSKKDVVLSKDVAISISLLIVVFVCGERALLSVERDRSGVQQVVQISAVHCSIISCEFS